MGINNSDFARGFGNTTFVVPPGWGKPGYVPASKVPLYLGIQMTLTAIMVTVVALRIYTRIFLVRALGWDDAWVLMASVSCIGLMTMHILIYKSGMGLHAIDAVNRNMRGFRNISYLGFLASLVHIVTMYLIKMSILLFVHRIVARGRTINVVYALYVIVTLFAITSLLLYISQCSPIKAFYAADYTGPHKCLSMAGVMYYNSAGNAVLDVALLLLPMPDLIAIKINRRQKSIIIAIFAVGGVATVASIVRVAWMGKFQDYSDITWEAADPMLLTGVEPLLGAICCSVPALKKLFSRVFSGLSSTGGSRSRSRSRSCSRSGLGHAVAMHLRLGTNRKSLRTTESTEEFKPDFRVPLKHKFQSTPNNSVTIETISRDTLETQIEPAPGQIAVRTEYSQTVVERTWPEGCEGSGKSESGVF